MEYKIIFEDAPEAEDIIQIAKSNGVAVEEADDANFGGGETFSLIANGICAIAALAQIFNQFGFIRKERVILMRPGKPIIRNISLEDVEKLLKEDAEKD